MLPQTSVCFLGLVLLQSNIQDVREELRSSMAKDDVTLKNESLRIAEDPDYMHLAADAGHMLPASSLSNVSSVDFQKKFTFSKHELLDNNSSGSFLDQLVLRPLLGMYGLKSIIFGTFTSRTLMRGS